MSAKIIQFPDRKAEVAEQRIKDEEFIRSFDFLVEEMRAYERFYAELDDEDGQLIFEGSFTDGKLQ